MHRVGLDSRDYMTEGEGDGSSSVRALAGLSATTQLIIINAFVFLIWQLWHRSAFLYDHFLISPDGLVEQHRVWTLVTHAFSHRELWHLLWNMLFLYLFGRDLEQAYGKRAVVVVYLAGAVAGGATQVAFDMHRGWMTLPAQGASAAVMAIIAATTLSFPNRRVLIWGMVPAPLWALAALFLVVDLVGLVRELRGELTTTGHVGHLGGALAGALLYKLVDLRAFGPSSARAGRSSTGWLTSLWRRRRFRVLPPLRDAAPTAPRHDDAPAHDEGSRRIDPAVEERVDELLRKINREGLQSLTSEEKAFLEEASTQYRAK